MRDIVRYCLKKYAANHTALPAGDIAAEYEDRFYRYMNEADMGSERGRFTSYLNIFSGLAAYEILREKGLTQEEGIKAYDSMCAFFRKLSSVLYKGADLLPNGYEIVRRLLLDDLEGEKKICWDIEILQGVLHARLVCVRRTETPFKIHQEVYDRREWHGVS